MQIISTASEARAVVSRDRCQGLRVGVVPTMGALHQGHLSLVEQSIAECQRTVVTIFVNPTQFSPDEDLDRYPRSLDRDQELVRDAGATALFVPSVEEMYPPGSSTFVEPPEVSRRWEGECRPGHFRGVCTIVLKLLQAIPADCAYFGRKDYQQLKVIESMVRDLGLGVEVIPCETVREPDGLAMSSRNRYLDAGQRQRAVRISAALRATRQAVAEGQTDVAALEADLRELLLGEAGTPGGQGVDRIDYAAIVDGRTLEPVAQVMPGAVALVAALVGDTRLIDNLSLDPST